MKILILSASVGSGHMRAAQAVEAALRESYPGATVRTVDVLEMAGVVFRKVYGDGYLGMANSAPHLLGYLYDALDRPGGLTLVPDAARGLVQRFCLRAFARFMRQESWDVVINTHFLPAELIAYLRRRGRLDVPQIIAVTDFEVHRFWAHSPCEHYFTASQEGAAALRHWGVAGEDISVTGIPIHPIFSTELDRAACLRSQGLAGDRPILLQLAGGNGMGPIEEVFDGLSALPMPVDLVVVAGRNEGARARLLARPTPSRHRTHILGYTGKMHELMAVADLIVSKPGGLTVSEALACGVPVVAVHPIPGQEGRNCDFLLENGAGIKINALAALTQKVGALLGSPERLSLMRRKARALGRPRAAFAVAERAARQPEATAKARLSCAAAADKTLAVASQSASLSH